MLHCLSPASGMSSELVIKSELYSSWLVGFGSLYPLERILPSLLTLNCFNASLMWKHASGVRWWNQLKAYIKKIHSLQKAEKWASGGVDFLLNCISHFTLSFVYQYKYIYIWFNFFIAGSYSNIFLFESFIFSLFHSIIKRLWQSPISPRDK